MDTSGTKNKAKENLKMNKVEEIMLSPDSWIDLLNDSFIALLSCPIPECILRVICDYAMTFGAKRNFIEKRTPFHEAVDRGNIDKADELLKTGMYFVDQYGSTSKFYWAQTPLFRAVFKHWNVGMVEFLILNGARRGIRDMISKLENCSTSGKGGFNEEHRKNLLAILCPHNDEDSFRYRRAGW